MICIRSSQVESLNYDHFWEQIASTYDIQAPWILPLKFCEPGGIGSQPAQ